MYFQPIVAASILFGIWGVMMTMKMLSDLLKDHHMQVNLMIHFVFTLAMILFIKESFKAISTYVSRRTHFFKLTADSNVSAKFPFDKRNLNKIKTVKKIVHIFLTISPQPSLKILAANKA